MKYCYNNIGTSREKHTGQHIGPIFKGHEKPFLFFFDFLTLQDGTDMLSRNVGKGLTLDAA
jgi:hypothetical protein